ncbi:MAG: hypothetical protein DWQ06_15475 [Calditrichaeota bacterium]|nr:MAG: hypothetical protein DWQ06_15475 [Calditrichota bacterium]
MKLEKLIDIARLLKKRDFKPLNNFLHKKDTKSNIWKLYEGILEGKYKTDSEASLDIFGEKIPGKKFRELKNNVKEQMINSIMELDISINASDRLKATYKCEKNLFVAKMLGKTGSSNASRELYKQTYLLAKKHKITDVILYCLKNLSTFYVFQHKKKVLYDSFKEINFYNEVYAAEIQAQEFYHKIIYEVTNSRILNPNSFEIALEYSKIIEENIEKFKEYDSIELHNYYFRIKSSAYEAVGDIKNALKVYEQTEKRLLNSTIKISPQLLAELNTEQLVCLVYLQDFEKGKLIAEKIKKILPKQTANYISFLNHYFLLSIQSNDLIKAFEILMELESHELFKISFLQEAEYFILFKSYIIIALLNSKNPLEIQKGIELKNNFNVFRAIDKLSETSKDKKGLNVSIIILRILFYLIEGDYSKVLDKMEGLKQYNQRYLKKNEFYRTDCFIKMILMIEKYDFDYNQLKIHSLEYVKKLSSFRTKSTNSFFNWEIIPYENLWTIILETLRKNKES